MIDQSPRSSDRRRSLRFAIDQRSNIRITLDSASPDGESIQSVTLTDISREGLMASDAGQLVPGAQVSLEIPLIGWREAEVMWIVDNRAGCRFARPLDLEELGIAAAHSERLAAECPTLATQIAEIVAHPRWIEPANDRAVPVEAAPSRWPVLLALGVALLAGFILAFRVFDPFI
jgi:hypothetical protein